MFIYKEQNGLYEGEPGENRAGKHSEVGVFLGNGGRQEAGITLEPKQQSGIW